MARAFISYRREDSQDISGRLYDHLCLHWGGEQVFKDVDSIPLGMDFRRHLSQAVAKCEVMLVVIGPRWLDVAKEGARRLDDPTDFVRIEIETALQRGAVVVPVLVGGARIPKGDQLPESLRDLAYRQASVLRPDPDFRGDVKRIINGIELATQPPVLPTLPVAPPATGQAPATSYAPVRTRETPQTAPVPPLPVPRRAPPPAPVARPAGPSLALRLGIALAAMGTMLGTAVAWTSAGAGLAGVRVSRWWDGRVGARKARAAARRAEPPPLPPLRFVGAGLFWGVVSPILLGGLVGGLFLGTPWAPSSMDETRGWGFPLLLAAPGLSFLPFLWFGQATRLRAIWGTFIACGLATTPAFILLSIGEPWEWATIGAWVFATLLTSIIVLPLRLTVLWGTPRDHAACARASAKHTPGPQ